MLFDEMTGHVIAPYEGWAPYCLVCSTMARMKPTDYGWKCRACGNEIGHDLCHHDQPGK